MEKGRTLGVVLVLCLLLAAGILPCDLRGQEESAQPQTLASASIRGETYYLIRTEAELRAINANAETLGRHYLLAGDITLNGTWTPIGSRMRPFTGAFDGNGYTIYGLTATGRCAGMFGWTRGAEIVNVKLQKANLQTGAFFPIAACARDTRIEHCSINAEQTAEALSPEGTDGSVAL